MAWYNAGTASVANNSVDVTGVNTLWVDNVDAGQAFIGPDGFPYEIASITSATALKLRRPYRGATAAGQAYTIMPAQGYVMALARAAAELVQSFAGVRDGIGQGVFPAGSVAAPGFRFSGDENTGITQTGPDTFAIVVGGQVVANFNVNGFAPERILIGDGTAGAPALGFISDPDTGFNRPSANALGIVTGGVQRAVIDSSGNLVVRNPAASNVGYTQISAGGAGGISGFVSSYDGANVRRCYMNYWDGTQVVGAMTEGSTPLTFGTNGSERLRISSTGNIGIGHTNPADKFTVVGTVRCEGSTGGLRYFSRNGNEEFWIYAENGRARFRSGYADRFFEFDGYQIFPSLDNATNLGTGAQRFGTVYAATGSINTSDKNAKIIEENGGIILDEWLDAWGDVQWCRFKFKDAVEGKGTDARWHVGLIAQRVRDAFAALNLDATEIGLLCYDEWEEEREPIMEERQIDTEIVVVGQEPTGLFLANGEPHMRDITEERPIMDMVDTGETRVTLEAGNRWGLRYDECQAMEAAWQRRELARGLQVAADRIAAAEAAAAAEREMREGLEADLRAEFAEEMAAALARITVLEGGAS